MGMAKKPSDTPDPQIEALKRDIESLRDEMREHRASGNSKEIQVQFEWEKAWFELAKGQVVLSTAFLPAMAAFAALADSRNFIQYLAWAFIADIISLLLATAALFLAVFGFGDNPLWPKVFLFLTYPFFIIALPLFLRFVLSNI